MAGYMDADGYIRYAGGSPRLELVSIFPWILDEFQARFGGSIRELAGERRTWRWDLSGSSAAAALVALQPHLYVKKTQARLVLEAREMPPGPERNCRIGEIRALKHCNYEHIQ